MTDWAKIWWKVLRNDGSPTTETEDMLYSDMSDAMQMASMTCRGIPESPQEYDLVFTSMTLDELKQYDAMDWAGWDFGELSSASKSELHGELSSWRGEEWADRVSSNWIASKGGRNKLIVERLSPIIVVQVEHCDDGDGISEYSEICDGRGRTTLAIALGCKDDLNVILASPRSD